MQDILSDTNSGLSEDYWVEKTVSPQDQYTEIFSGRSE